MTTLTQATPLESNEHLSDFEMLQIVANVVKHNPLGLFTTVGLNGAPHARWMVAAVGDDGVSHIYSLTGRHTRKLQEIARNASVCWVFTSPHQEQVVTITGKAAMLESLYGAGVAWAPLMQATGKYAMTALTNNQDTTFAAVETVVEHIEIICPRLGIYAPRSVPFFQPVPASQAGRGDNI